MFILNLIGKFCRLIGKESKAEFKMYVNMLVKFEDDKYARVRKEVNGLRSEFDLSLMPMEPKEIIFNDLHSILCNVDYEEW